MTSFADASIRVVPGEMNDARYKAAEISSDAGREMTPVRVFRQGDRIMLCGVLSTRVLARVLEHNASQPGMTADKALTARNRPVSNDHRKAIKSYLLGSIKRQDRFIIPPVTLNSTGDVDILIPEGDSAFITGYAVFPEEASVHITDGQHRYLAICDVLKELQGTLEGDQFARMGIPFMMTIESDPSQTHQDFADAGRTKPLPASLLAAYDMRQSGNRAVKEITDRARLLAGRTDATSSMLSANSPHVFLVSQVRQFVKSALVGTPAPSEQAFARSAESTIDIPESFDKWVGDRIIFLDVMTELTPDWRELAALPPPGRADAAEVMAKTKAIREKQGVCLSPTFLRVLGLVSYEVFASMLGEDSRGDGLEAALREIMNPVAGIDWSRSAEIWKGNIVADGKVANHSSSMKAAARAVLSLMQK